MAVLAPQDWQPPRDPSPIASSRSMEPRNHNHTHLHPTQHSTSSSRQPSPETHTPSPPPAAPYQQAAQPPYSAQPWQPSPQAPAFYPAYPSYFPQQAPHPHAPHQHPPHPAPGPYFDPNQHFAQWAYQQMMFNAQAQAQFHAQQQGGHPMLAQPQPDFSQGQRTRTSSGGNTPPTQQAGDFFQPQRSGSASPPDQQGFHPYGAARRPVRQASSPAELPQPPYARADAAGSSSSLNSGSSGRSRKGSNPSRPSGSPTQHHTREHSRSSSGGGSSPHPRGSSSSSERTASVKSVPLPVVESQPARRPAKPSPLGQATYPVEREPRPSASSGRPDTANTVRPEAASTTRPESAASTVRTAANASKRLSISKDDSQLGEPVPVPNASMVRSGGLKGRLRRALSFNAASTLEEDHEADDGKLNSRRKALANANKVNAAATAAAATASSSAAAGDDGSDSGSPTTPTGPSPSLVPSTVGPSEPSLKGKSRARRAASLFNTKLNASTDNISLSSTVSSASVMIRKLGSMGRLARKNSLMGITGLFKDKDKDKDKIGDGDGPGKGKGKKGMTATASVTHATAEIDRGSGSEGPELNGLSPAAKLARQHTLRSEAAARQKAAEDARARDAAAAAVAAAGGVGGAPVPVWERNAATRGTRHGPFVEYEDGSGDEDGSGSGSEDGSEDGTYDAHRGWDEGEEDVTIRVGSVQPQQRDEEVWAVGIRRSIERTRRPTKGILKNANTYDQNAILEQAPNASFGARVRSNSYNQAPHNHHNEPGPLARIPSPDPDHIDGLHQQHNKPNGTDPIGATFIPPFTFDVPRSESPSSVGGRASPQPEKGFFNMANMNSSAPALSTMQGHIAPSLTHRAATTPAKRLAFAANLSIYDTFSPNVYDRRSEPATCNRLTPALAQRIKEELNSYKMEEMEVHAASRIHTQFFV